MHYTTNGCVSLCMLVWYMDRKTTVNMHYRQKLEHYSIKELLGEYELSRRNYLHTCLTCAQRWAAGLEQHRKLMKNRQANLLNARESRIRPLPALQIYLQPCVTLTFDLLTPKVDRFKPLPHEPPVPMPICIKIG